MPFLQILENHKLWLSGVSYDIRSYLVSRKSSKFFKGSDGDTVRPIPIKACKRTHAAWWIQKPKFLVWKGE